LSYFEIRLANSKFEPPYRISGHYRSVPVRPVIRAGFDFFVKKTKKLKTNFQLYSILLDFYSSSDALFLHTPNPDNSQFPFKISDLRSTSTLKNKELNDYINGLDGYEKLYGLAGEHFCLRYKKDAGRAF